MWYGVRCRGQGTGEVFKGGGGGKRQLVMRDRIDNSMERSTHKIVAPVKGGPRTPGHRHTEKYGPSMCVHPLKGGSEVGKTRGKKRVRPLEGGGILTRSQSRVQRETGRAVRRSGRHRESLGGEADGAQPGGMAAADSREEQSTDRERSQECPTEGTGNRQ